MNAEPSRGDHKTPKETDKHRRGKVGETPTVFKLALSDFDRLFMENNLLRAIGYMFCHDRKRAAQQTDTITNLAAIDTLEETAKRPITIELHPSYGQPGQLAFKVCLAILAKLSSYGQPVPDRVFFTRRELARTLDRAWTAKTGKELVHAIRQLNRSVIVMSFYDRRTRAWAVTEFRVVSRLTTEGIAGQIHSIEIGIDQTVRRSLQERYFSCLNYTRIRGLSTIGAALYIRLFHHFSNLLEHGGRQTVTFRKRYDAICTEWLGGLAVRSHKSVIDRDQLGPHLAALVECRFLKSYAVDRAREGEGFVLTFRPGVAFFEEYETFYKRRHQGELQFQFRKEEADIHNPLSIARRFHELRTGEELVDAEFNRSEVEYARKLASQLGYEEALAFVEYGLSRARQTEFPVQTLQGLKGYLLDFQRDRRLKVQAKEASARQAAAQKAEDVRMEYDRFRERRADELLKAAPEDVRSAIEETARHEARVRSATFPKLYDMSLRVARRRLTLERYPIPPFEEWNTSRRCH